MSEQVTTVVFGDRRPPPDCPVGTRQDSVWSFAHSDAERVELAAEIRAVVDGRSRKECHVYAWDRRCSSGTVLVHDEALGGPVWTNVEDDAYPVGVLYVVAEGGYGALGLHLSTGQADEWDVAHLVSRRRGPLERMPVIRYNLCGITVFHPSSVLPLEQVHAAVEEYMATGARPEAVDWAEVNWF